MQLVEAFTQSTWLNTAMGGMPLALTRHSHQVPSDGLAEEMPMKLLDRQHQAIGDATTSRPAAHAEVVYHAATQKAPLAELQSVQIPRDNCCALLGDAIDYSGADLCGMNQRRHLFRRMRIFTMSVCACSKPLQIHSGTV